MKSAFIISSYPSDQIKIDLLKSTIKCVKDNGFDIVVTTNYPIKDDEIYSMIDYFIFDKLDIHSFIEEFNVSRGGNGWWHKVDNFTVSVAFDNAYHFDLYRCIYNAVGLLKSLNYDFFYYLEGDSLLDEEEIKHLISLRDQMFNENKNMIFSKTIDNIYKTIIFGGKPSFFMEKMNIPYDLESWINDNNLHLSSLENLFYDQFKLYEDVMLILDNDFGSTNMNKISKSHENYIYPIYYDIINNNFYFFIVNHTINIYNIEFYIDEKLYKNFIINPGWYHIWAENDFEVNFLNKKLKEVVYSDGIKIFDDEIILTDKKIQYFKCAKNFHPD